ncbi:resolvase [Clostridia bacterium]|nr:resolvase [Clostridia bacterium]
MVSGKTYAVGIYVRLSKEDGTQGDANVAPNESVSIENQKLLLTKYVENQPGWILHDTYADDGWSGTNFRRPGFTRMLEDAKNGVINLILVKDMSRFGRNFIENGQFMEYVFPAIGCRLVAVEDRYDSVNGSGGGNEFIHFKNFFNELHCRDTSNKVKTVRKTQAKSGKFMGSRAPYGYKKDPQDKHRLIIDEPAAAVVRRIFDMRCRGYGYRAIVSELNGEGILPPRENWYNELGQENPLKGNGLWTNTVIMRLTRNEAYLGHMVQGKQGSISYKNHKLVGKPEEEWIRVENTHEPIVSKEQWDMAWEIAASKRKPRKMSDGDTNMYAGLLRCGDCGSFMRCQLRRYKHKDGTEVTARQFICGNYAKSGKHACTVHAVGEKSLTEMALANIRADAAFVTADEELVSQALKKHLRAETANVLSSRGLELAALDSRVSELERKIIPSLYEDKVSGVLPGAVFSGLLDKYEKERLEKSEKAGALRVKIAEEEQTRSDASAWIRLMKKYASLDTLSAAVLLELIEHIEIGEAVSKAGEKVRDVKIFYRFAGHVDLAALTLEERLVCYGQAV